MSFLNNPIIKKRMQGIEAHCEFIKEDGICKRDFSVCGELFLEPCNFDLQVELSDTYPSIEKVMNDLGITTNEQQVNNIMSRIYANMELRNEEQLTPLRESQKYLFYEHEYTIKDSYNADNLFEDDWIKGAFKEDEE